MTSNEKNIKLIKAMLNFGYFYSPFFSDEFVLDISDREVIKYDEREDILVINSERKKKENAYKVFQREHYYNHFDNEIRQMYKDILKPIILLTKTKEGVCFRYFSVPGYVYLARKYSMPVNEDPLDDFTPFVESVTKRVTHIHEMLEDYDKNKKNSKYYEELKNEFTFLKHLDNPNISFETKITVDNSIKSAYEDSKRNMKILKGLEEVNSDFMQIHDFLNCFDSDEFFLLFAKIVMEKSRIHTQKYKDVSCIFPQVYQYIHFVEELDFKEYNPKIKYAVKEHGRIKEKYYSFRDLKREVREYLKSIPNATFKYISIFDEVLNNVEDMTIEEQEKNAVKYRYGEDLETLSASWEFIKKGETDKVQEVRSRDINESTERRTREPADIAYRMEMFQRTDYVRKIVGTGKFSGYVGYIYPNGCVAFEKFYDEFNRPIVESNATYFMNIKNFRYFSSLDKQEIMEYIDSTENPDVRRKYHSKNWWHNCMKIIEGDYYTEDMKEEVDNLIKQLEAENKLKLKGKK